MRLASIALIAISASALTSAQSPKLTREAELAAVPSAQFPYAGFWKPEDCTVDFGLAISPAGSPGLYSVSFCGPGGCFAPGTYRPDTTLVNDDKYWVIDANTIEVRKGDGSGQAYRYVRCPRREVP
jgi:hypothetical protein